MAIGNANFATLGLVNDFFKKVGKKGKTSPQHKIQYDTKTKCICGFIVVLTAQNFRGDIARSSCILFFRGQILQILFINCEPKIYYFDPVADRAVLFADDLNIGKTTKMFSGFKSL